MEIRLRYNTNDTNGENPWRLLIDGVENLVKEVHFQIPVSTSTDIIPEVGIKYHIGADANSVEINEGVVIIK
jgi:hypothetical protein